MNPKIAVRLNVVADAHPAIKSSDFIESDEQMMASLERELREAESALKSPSELSPQEVDSLRARVNRCKQTLLDLGYARTRDGPS
jgi:hypothetical protein